MQGRHDQVRLRRQVHRPCIGGQKLAQAPLGSFRQPRGEQGVRVAAPRPTPARGPLQGRARREATVLQVPGQVPVQQLAEGLVEASTEDRPQRLLVPVGPGQPDPPRELQGVLPQGALARLEAAGHEPQPRLQPPDGRPVQRDELAVLPRDAAADPRRQLLPHPAGLAGGAVPELP